MKLILNMQLTFIKGASNSRLNLTLPPQTKLRYSYHWSREHLFESGDYAAKLLAHQARAQAALRVILAIKSPSGDVVSDLESRLYSDQYTTDSPQDTED